MECIRELIDPNKLQGIVRIPERLKTSRVEIIVLPFREVEEKSYPADKFKAVEELNGLISDQSREKLEQFDLVISERNPFRRHPIQL